MMIERQIYDNPYVYIHESEFQVNIYSVVVVFT